MIEPKEFYGQALVREGNRPLTEQVYNILLREIVSRRWCVGDRMPSFKNLIEMTNVSQYPLGTALNRLEAEGYINKIEHKGIFVKSTEPRGAVIGTIGLIAESGNFSSLHWGIPKFSEGFGLIDVRVLQKHATSLGYSLKIIEKPDDIKSAEDIKGIISFIPKDKIDKFNHREIPTVFVGVEDPLSSPCVTGDCYTAMYKLTRHLMELGHRDIAVFAPDFWDEKLFNDAMGGHIRAMNAAGLPVNMESVRISRQMPFNELKSAKDFLAAFPKSTAVLAMAVDTALKIEEYAEMVGVEIPERLSLACLQVGALPKHSEILGAYYEWNLVIKTCFDIILDRNMEINSKTFSRVTMPPMLNTDKQHSVAAPYKGRSKHNGRRI